MSNSIICLFQVANNYDQPDNDLVCWWKTKPSIETLAKVLGVSFTNPNNEAIVALVNIFNTLEIGNSVRLGETDYRLEEVKEGKVLGT